MSSNVHGFTPEKRINTKSTFKSLSRFWPVLVLLPVAILVNCCCRALGFKLPMFKPNAQVGLLLASSYLIEAGAQISSPLGVYNSSTTPSSLPWNTYNYCNAPHVNAKHYELPPINATLVFLEMFMRHHKRTPDNLYPNENELNPPEGWDCSEMDQMDYVFGTVPIHHAIYTPTSQAFLSEIWNGTCDSGQLTPGGVQDAIHHGQDFWSVYHDKLGFLQSVDPDEIFVRTSYEDLTHQVAGSVLYGMEPNLQKKFTVNTQPANIDSIVPSYPCPAADNIRDAYQSVPAWLDHIEQNQDLATSLGETLGTAGLVAWTSWYDHYFDTFTSRTCNGHPLPCNSTGTCVSQEDASRVFAIGDFEYNYIWNTNQTMGGAQNATQYDQLTFGVMISEIAHSFREWEAGHDSHKLRLHVGHDGSMIRLNALIGLGNIEPLRWPGLGSEVIMEVWKLDGRNYVRVFHDGTVVKPLGWVEFDEFVSMLESQVPNDIYQACQASS